MKAKYISPNTEVMELNTIQPMLTTSMTVNEETVNSGDILSRDDEDLFADE